MAGLTLSAIREALAAQIVAYTQRGVNAKPYRVGGTPTRQVVIEPDIGDYIDYWVTQGGPVGLARVRLVIVIEADNADEHARRRLDDFLSVGQGNGSSIVDAVMSDVTLGGLVDTCHIRAAQVNDTIAIARLAIEVHVRKIDAVA
jgi:hypothetical protein